MSSSPESFLYVEKYRPKTIDECVLPERFREFFNSMVEKKQIQHLLLCGSQGTGKTTIAKALCNELNLEYMVINASMNGNIDTLRGQIQSFASTMSFHSPYKVVILDEADYLNCFGENQKIKIINDSGVIENKSLLDLCDSEVKLLSYDFVTNEVIHTSGIVFKSGEKEIFEVELDDGSIIHCTADHPFFNSNGETITIDNDTYLFSI